MHAWLRAAADTLSRETGVSRHDLELTSRDVETLLDAAGFAAHESGARTNAPLLCYLLGRASLAGVALPDLVTALERMPELAESSRSPAAR